MKLPAATFEFGFLTACFSGTAEGKEARESELRVPPIRGHVRMWHVAAFGARSCAEVWGSTAGEGSGSRVGMRLAATPPPSEKGSALLPHKDRQGGSRPALAAGTRATLELTRLPPCRDEQWAKARAAVRLWLLLGTLGLRSNRAAGSIWPAHPPADAAALKAELTRLGLTRTAVALIGMGAGKSAAELRETASDTVEDRRGDVFGQSSPRKPSPVRFKVIRLGDGYCLLAHAPEAGLLTRAGEMLLCKPRPERWQALGPWKLLVT